MSMSFGIGTVAQADGGAGGYDGNGGAGGTPTAPHGDGGNVTFVVGGGGGGGAMDIATGLGGNGGDGALSSSPVPGDLAGAGGGGASKVATSLGNLVDKINGISFTGDRGDDGAAGAGGGGGPGGGGSGGAGLVFQAVPTAGLVNSAALTGGNGGAGATSGGVANNFVGAGGGEGGAGLLILNGNLSNSGAIAGGAGGNGGASKVNDGEFNGQGGDGGAGVVMINGGAINNTGTISGGTNGWGGAAPGVGLDGALGAGIIGANIAVINSGTISSGRDQAGGYRTAIQFTGGANSLTLASGSKINGIVDATSGQNALILGGAGNASFDVGSVGAGAQYRGFSSFDKNDVSTWTLTGTDASHIGWTINGGALVGNVTSIQGASITDNGTLQFDQSEVGTYTGTILGTGTLIKSGAGVLVLSGDNSAFNGSTNVALGTLLVDGTLGGSVNAGSGAVLGGSGSIGTASIGSGASVSPGDASAGNRIGTLGIKGDFSQAAGSTYVADIDPAGRSDLINATGSAALNGAMLLPRNSATNGEGFLPGTRYTLLTAGGGVTGTYGIATQDMPFLNLALDYDANDVYLDIARTAVSFPSVATTRNQISAATAVEATGVGTPLYDGIVGLTAPAARSAFDQLSGDIRASLKGMLIEDSRFTRDAVIDRLHDAFAPDGTAQANATWTRVFGAWGHTGTDGNAASLSRSIGGFMLGADMPLADHWRTGVAGGYSHTSASAQDASADVDTYHLAAYAGGQYGNLGVKLGTAYSWNRLNTRRALSFADDSGVARGRYDAGTAQIFADLGYRIPIGQANVEPFANLAYVNLHTNGYSENGSVADLRSAGSNNNATFSTLGLRGDTTFQARATAIKVHASLGWRHAFGERTPQANTAFADQSAGGFTIYGLPIARDALAADAGLDLNLARNVTVGISYNGVMSGPQQDHGVRGNLVWTF
jgi:outer membrane autotransporter protein